MQRVCAWTNRIRSEGKWVPMDQFPADKLHFKISHGTSDEGVGAVSRRSHSRRGSRRNAHSRQFPTAERHCLGAVTLSRATANRVRRSSRDPARCAATVRRRPVGSGFAEELLC